MRVSKNLIERAKAENIRQKKSCPCVRENIWAIVATGKEFKRR
jgi:hypothetical protein